jgi:hypothetical protein
MKRERVTVLMAVFLAEKMKYFIAWDEKVVIQSRVCR